MKLDDIIKANPIILDDEHYPNVRKVYKEHYSNKRQIEYNRRVYEYKEYGMILFHKRKYITNGDFNEILEWHQNNEALGIDEDLIREEELEYKRRKKDPILRQKFASVSERIMLIYKENWFRLKLLDNYYEKQIEDYYRAQDEKNRDAIESIEKSNSQKEIEEKYQMEKKKWEAEHPNEDWLPF